MAKFNERSWLVNRFKNLYPGVMADLAMIDEDNIYWAMQEIDVNIVREQLDLNTKAGVKRLTTMVKNYVEAWKEAYQNG